MEVIPYYWIYSTLRYENIIVMLAGWNAYRFAKTSIVKEFV